MSQPVAALSRSVVLALLLLPWPDRVLAATVTMTTAKDNTLYQSATGALSNGRGIHMFVGLTAQTSGRIRRSLMSFNIAASVPPGAIVTAARLTLSLSASAPNADDFSLYRLTRDWGEGTSDAGGEEGSGIASTNGDATWIHAIKPAPLWTTQGGDFMATPSATTYVDGTSASVTWGSTTQMVSDVQGWLNAPASNFGWILKTPEAPGGATAKRFDTRENGVLVQPSLEITYSLAPGDMNCDAVVNEQDIGPFIEALLDPAAYLLVHPGCDPDNADTNFDGAPDGKDVRSFLAALGL